MVNEESRQAVVGQRPRAGRRWWQVEGRWWRVVLDRSFYLVAAAGVVWFGLYLKTYGKQVLLYGPLFVQFAGATVVISVVSLVLATGLGVLGAAGRGAKWAVVRWVTGVYVEVMRGTPAIVQLLVWYYGVGLLLSQVGFDPYTVAFRVMTVLQSNSLVPDAFNGYFYGIVGLSWNYGAYLTEVFRAGIEGVDRGQREAGLSLGLSGKQVWRRVVWPQAMRLTIPPVTNQFISIIQDSSLLSIISVFELEHVTYNLAGPQTDAGVKLFVFVLGALCYLGLCFPLSRLARYLEARLALSS